jgi:hypothetical protein
LLYILHGDEFAANIVFMVIGLLVKPKNTQKNTSRLGKAVYGDQLKKGLFF